MHRAPSRAAADPGLTAAGLQTPGTGSPALPRSSHPRARGRDGGEARGHGRPPRSRSRTISALDRPGARLGGGLRVSPGAPRASRLPGPSSAARLLLPHGRSSGQQWSPHRTTERARQADSALRLTSGRRGDTLVRLSALLRVSGAPAP